MTDGPQRGDSQRGVETLVSEDAAMRLVDRERLAATLAERRRIAAAVRELDIEFEAGEGMVILSEVLAVIEVEG